MVYIGPAGPFTQECARFSTDFYKGVLLARLLDAENARDSFIFLSYQKLISKPIQELNLLNRETKDKQDIIMIFNSIINHIHLEIKDMLGRVNMKELMISLYSMSSYMTKLHFYMDIVSRGELTEKKIHDTDYFDLDEKTILISLFVNKDDCASIFNSWRGFDKAVIQTLFYQLEINKLNYGKDPIDLNVLIQLYNYGSTLVTLINERELVTSGFYHEPIVRVFENDIIINGEMTSRRSQLLKNANDNQYKEGLVQYDKEIMEKLDFGIFKQYGFKASTLDKAFGNKLTSRLLKHQRAYVIIIEHKKLVQLIRNEGKCSREEAENVIKYFTLEDNEIDKRYDSFEKYDSRLLEHPVVRFDDKHYYFSYYLMIYAIFILKTKIVYNLVKLDINKNSRIIQKRIKEKFEKQILDTISPYMDHSKLNVQKFCCDVNGKNREINLKYQMDVISVRGNKLYLFECKDITYKFTALGIRSDIHKTLKFIDNLHGKMDEIIRYQEELTIFFGAQFEEIVPVLVFKHYNATGISEIDCRGVSVFSFTELKDWINWNF